MKPTIIYQTMFSFVNSQTAAMFKPLGFLAAIQLLNFFGVFTNIYNWFKFLFGQIFGANYAALTGLDSNWLFMQGTGMPVQMRYTHSAIRDRASWQYMERTGKWIHRGCNFSERGHNFPFVLINLNVNGSRYELTEFFANHMYYHPAGTAAIPEPLMLVNAWSIHSHNWFNLEQLERAYFEIMNMNCEIIRVPIIPPGRQHLSVYYEQFGLTLDNSDEESGEEESGEEESGEEESGEEESGEEESGEDEEESGEEESGEDEEKSGEEESNEDEEGSGEDESGEEESEESEKSEKSESGEEGSGEEKSSSDTAISEEQTTENKTNTPPAICQA